ncbi:77_t:CDS:1, partial [Racocetra persica]
VSRSSLFVPRVESFSTILNIQTIRVGAVNTIKNIPSTSVGTSVPTEITTAIPISTTANIPFTNTVKATTLNPTIQTMTTAPVTIQQKTPSTTNTATSKGMSVLHPYSTYNQLPKSSTTTFVSNPSSNTVKIEFMFWSLLVAVAICIFVFGMV